MKAYRVKYRGVPNGRESILGSRNNPKGRSKVRTRRWNGPRGKLLSGTGKRLARLVFDARVKDVLS